MARPIQQSIVVALLVSFFVLSAAKPATAQIGPSKGQVAAVVVGIVAVGVAIGVTAAVLLRREPSLTGCVAGAPGSFTLTDESTQAVFVLTGNTAALRAGERMRFTGHKQKAASNGQRTFSVDQLRRDYGPCKLVPAATP